MRPEAVYFGQRYRLVDNGHPSTDARKNSDALAILKKRAERREQTLEKFDSFTLLEKDAGSGRLVDVTYVVTGQDATARMWELQDFSVRSMPRLNQAGEGRFEWQKQILRDILAEEKEINAKYARDAKALDVNFLLARGREKFLLWLQSWKAFR